jgi:hypothetical protein
MYPLLSHFTSSTSSMPAGAQPNIFGLYFAVRSVQSCLDPASKKISRADVRLALCFLYHCDNVELICLHPLHEPNDVYKA